MVMEVGPAKGKEAEMTTSRGWPTQLSQRAAVLSSSCPLATACSSGEEQPDHLRFKLDGRTGQVLALGGVALSIQGLSCQPSPHVSHNHPLGLAFQVT